MLKNMPGGVIYIYTENKNQVTHTENGEALPIFGGNIKL